MSSRLRVWSPCEAPIQKEAKFRPDSIMMNKLAKLRRHASRIHFALIHFGKIHFGKIQF